MGRARGEEGSVQAAPRLAYRFAGLELRPGRQLLREGSPIPIGSTALELLGVLVMARGELVTKEELFDAIWSNVVVVDNTLHQHVRALRLALGSQAALIRTVARRGYVLAGTVEEVAVDAAAAPPDLGRPPAIAAPATPLIGREDELAAIEALLESSRCVTLIGPGGVGKTRLAIAIAQRRREGSTYLVELAAIDGGADVAAAVAPSVGLSGPSAVPPLARLRHALRDAEALLVVDNCEHLIDAAAALASDLLKHCPSLRILATSQRPLCISGERRFQVPMLGLPPAGVSGTPIVAASAAVQLLLARVGDCDSGLTFDDRALETAAELCRQLDGNALAIELAAVRVATLGVASVRAGLADRFRLLEGRRDVLPKHRSLTSMLDWSHDLLSAEQQATFRRVSVFSGGWTLDSAIDVLDGSKSRADIGTHLADLADWSLVGRDGSTHAPRFRMLETQRAYAGQKLSASGEQPRYALAHARHMTGLFEASYAEWDCTPDAEWISRYGPERDNLRTAIRTAVESPEPVLARRLVGASMWLWRAIGAIHEFLQILDDPSLQAGASPPDACLARTKLARAYALDATSTDSQRIRDAAGLAVDAFEGTADWLGAANATLCLGSAFAQLGDTTSHLQCLSRVESCLEGRPKGKTFGWFCGSHAWASQLAGELREALAWALRSRAAYRNNGGWDGETRALLHIADLKLAVGDVEGAIAVGSESVRRLEGGLHRDDHGRALANLGSAFFARHETALARDCWARALNELRGLDFTYWVFDHVALLAIAEGRDQCAARLVGYADAGYARLGKGLRVQNEQRARLRAGAYLKSRFRRAELETLMVEGANASEEEMIASALPPSTAAAIPIRRPRGGARMPSRTTV